MCQSRVTQYEVAWCGFKLLVFVSYQVLKVHVYTVKMVVTRILHTLFLDVKFEVERFGHEVCS